MKRLRMSSKILMASAVYFDKHLGAAHSECFSKSTFSHVLQFSQNFDASIRKIMTFLDLFSNPLWHKNASPSPYKTNERTFSTAET